MMKDRYSVIVAYQDRTRVSTVGTWAEITGWLAGQNPEPDSANPVAGVTIGRVIAESVMRHR